MAHITGNTSHKGFTIIEVLVALGLFSIIAIGITLTYSNILDASVSSRLKKSAIAIAEEEIELVRNLSYQDVGIIGGAPAGVLPATKEVVYGGAPFFVETFVRNIDDPFDGTLGSTTNDTAPGDYRLVTVRVSCPTCPRFTQDNLEFTTIAAPRGLENATNNGNLFVNVFDSSGLPLSDVDVVVHNSVLNPTVTITDETNNQGVLQLVDIPTSTTAYEITVSRPGYTSDRTYPASAFGSSTPENLHSTVAEQTITEISFAIDRVSELTVATADQFCQVVGNVGFDLEGVKLIARTPDVKKVDYVGTTTQANGSRVFDLEWDTYTIGPNDATYFFSGFTPQSATTTLNAGDIYSFNAIVEAKSNAGLLVTVRDDVGASLNDATVRLTDGGSYDTTFITGRRLYSETDWSVSNFNSQSGGIDADNPAGELHLVDLGGGTYATSTEHWLISNTVDFGVSTFRKLRWNPTSQPAQTTLRFQIATNLDQSTWNYVGPDGTANTYFTTSDTDINAIHTGDRYLRYRVHMSTLDENATPQLTDVTIEYTNSCTPNGQTFFNGLSAGTYTATINAATFQTATTSISVTANQWHQSEVTMQP